MTSARKLFAMKSIIYSFINRFWDGKSFLLPANAKKNMREMFAKDFADPLVEYLESDRSRMKDSCIECGMPVDSGKKGLNSIYERNGRRSGAKKKICILEWKSRCVPMSGMRISVCDESTGFSAYRK